MKSSWLVATCLAAVLCTTGCQNGHNRMDLALEGPWILYQDHNFDDHGKKISVLIAIAPGGATMATIGDMDPKYHHLPQISAGDGYYIPDSGVYCLMFDNRCARPGPYALTQDGYDDVKPLAMKFHAESGKTIWDMIESNNGGIALILPMPDSYSNDGIWRANFGPKFDENANGYSGNVPYSIGLVLHYTNGPWTINLRQCNVPARVTNCVQPAPDIDHTRIPNTGTLRVMMRAPDTEDACDMHVRMAYKMTMAILKPDINSDKAVIDPARRIDSKGYAHYEDEPTHSCLKADPQNPNPNPKKLYFDQGDDHGRDQAMGTSPTIQTLGTDISKTITKISGLENDTNRQNIEDYVLGPLRGASAATYDLDLQFPRVSQLRQIGALLHLAKQNWQHMHSQFQSQGSTQQNPEKNNAAAAEPNGETDTSFKEVLGLLDQLDDATTDTKNGSDCRAPITMATATQ